MTVYITRVSGYRDQWNVVFFYFALFVWLEASWAVWTVSWFYIFIWSSLTAESESLNRMPRGATGEESQRPILRV